MVTQKTIVEKLGISQSAVSMALSPNKTGRLSAELREKIIQEAEKLSYKPKASKRKRKALLLLSRIASSETTDEVCQRLLRGVQGFALDASFMTMQQILDGKSAAISAKLLSSVDGIVCVDIEDADLKEAIERDLPLVLLNRKDYLGRFDSVMPDHCDGIRKAVRHLYGLGHRSFAFFGLRTLPIHHAERYGAFQQVLAELDLPVPDPSRIFLPFRKEPSVLDAEQHARDALQAIRAMKSPPTAIVCATDLYAFLLIKLAASFGMQVPRDFSVAGFDNFKLYESCEPKISSITQPLEEMGRMAAKLLIDRVYDRSMPVRNMLVASEWIPRASVASPKDLCAN